MTAGVLTLVLLMGSATMAPADDLPLIPAPVTCERAEGTFTLDRATTVGIAHSATRVRERANVVLAILRHGTGLPLPVEVADEPADGAIHLALVPDRPDDWYRLQIDPRRALVRAGGVDGLGHGLQTLRQLLPPTVESPLPDVADDPGRGGLRPLPPDCAYARHDVAPRPAPRPAPIAAGAPSRWTLPCVTIDDRPRFGWRGVLLDSCRHFQDIAAIERLLDLMALHKLNVLHWHLTEDQAWRLEITAYPELTAIGAWRTDQDGVRYGGFYTQGQARHVVAYAARRGITVVPEIEMPGHSQAALAARPALGCRGEALAVQTCWGVWPDVYCAGNDATFRFLETVLDEVLAIFPSEFVHVGGDECPKDRWRACPACQARIAREGLADEDELQSWFIARMERWLAARGRRLVGWDEILEGGLPPGATVQSWRGTEGAIAAARQGHDTIVSPTSHCYLDADVGVTDLATAHAFDPVPDDLTAEEAAHVLGGEMNMWTEYAPQAVLDERLFPRLCALAEAFWSPPGGAYTDFWRRYRGHRIRLDRLGVRRAFEGRPVRLSAVRDGDGWVVAWRTPADLPGGDHAVLLSTGGAAERVGLAGTMRIATPGTISAQVLVDGEPYGAPWHLELVDHLAVGAAYECDPWPARDRYRPDDPGVVLDGILDDVDHTSGRWLAWEGPDATLTVDLGQPVAVREVQAITLHAGGKLIYSPERVAVSVSADGESWTPLGEARWRLPAGVFASVRRTSTVAGPPRPVRWVRIELEQRRDVPAWPWAPNSPPWLFLDQILVR
ncbi:family 20 glycosylhydrolase [bacterium]|nr:family 20 glycosylhydrolase [bacterium]